ncbi:unnamed protein product [Brachionus calyciflorus]|uniref:Uncharacterized protein n=1 Tax=Brachionus calyciflorus TaxID=104777 RepID=A0A813T647_9BILA|nr:unnamed protein product [Brachionus calyciflorus]
MLLENKNLLSLSGIVSSLKNFGGQLMDQFYEQLINIALETENIDDTKPELSLILNREILMCLLVHFRWVLRKSLTESNTREYSFGKILFLYKNLSNLYGDGFVNQILSAHDLWRFKNYFNLKLKIRSDEPERITIKFRNGIFFENCKTESLSEIFDNYKQIKRDIRINYGNSRVVKSKFNFENEVLMDKTNNSLLFVKFKPVGETKIKTDLESNLNYFYKDSFL